PAHHRPAAATGGRPGAPPPLRTQPAAVPPAGGARRATRTAAGGTEDRRVDADELTGPEPLAPARGRSDRMRKIIPFAVWVAAIVALVLAVNPRSLGGVIEHFDVRALPVIVAL